MIYETVFTSTANETGSPKQFPPFYFLVLWNSSPIQDQVEVEVKFWCSWWFYLRAPVSLNLLRKYLSRIWVIEDAGVEIVNPGLMD